MIILLLNIYINKKDKEEDTNNNWNSHKLIGAVMVQIIIPHKNIAWFAKLKEDNKTKFNGYNILKEAENFFENRKKENNNDNNNDNYNDDSDNDYI